MRDRACCLAVVAALSLAACGGADDPHGSVATPASTRWHDRGARLSAEIPRGWHVSVRPATEVVAPVQRLLVASFPLRRARAAGACGPFVPPRRLPAGGAMLLLFEYRGPNRQQLRRAAPRRARFRPGPARDYECLGHSQLVLFRERGRLLQAHVYLGARATPATRKTVLGVLDSLRVGRPDPRAAAVWVAPWRLLARAPRLGVACRRPNRIGCDRVGLAVWLRRPAEAVRATIAGRALPLSDRRWSGPGTDGRRRLFAGILRHAGLRHGALAPYPRGGHLRWTGRPPVKAAIELTVRQRADRYVRTSLVVTLAPGWG